MVHADSKPFRFTTRTGIMFANFSPNPTKPSRLKQHGQNRSNNTFHTSSFQKQAFGSLLTSSALAKSCDRWKNNKWNESKRKHHVMRSVHFPGSGFVEKFGRHAKASEGRQLCPEASRYRLSPFFDGPCHISHLSENSACSS